MAGLSPPFSIFNASRGTCDECLYTKDGQEESHEGTKGFQTQGDNGYCVKGRLLPYGQCHVTISVM